MRRALSELRGKDLEGDGEAEYRVVFSHKANEKYFDGGFHTSIFPRGRRLYVPDKKSAGQHSNPQPYRRS